MQPIGLFDSGLGGLTIARELLRVLPNERIIYFGDTAHLPYGDKSPSVLRGYARQITDFLLSHEVKAIVIACNTASAVATEVVREQAFPTPVIEVIGPTVEEALKVSDLNKVGVIGTQTTIRSSIYRQTIQKTRPVLEVVEKATPLLVPIIEDGLSDHLVCQAALDAYLSDPMLADIDCLILGCTHYPLIRKQIENYFSAKKRTVRVIDSSKPTVSKLKIALQKHSALADKPVPSFTNRFYVSDLNPYFVELTRYFAGNEPIELLEYNWKD